MSENPTQGAAIRFEHVEKSFDGAGGRVMTGIASPVDHNLALYCPLSFLPVLENPPFSPIFSSSKTECGEHHETGQTDH